MMSSQQQDQQSRIFYELSALVLNLLRSPPSPIPFSDQSPAIPSDSSRRRSSAPPQISPAGFASLMLGISMALMLCGSVTFFIGFMLMPWVLGLLWFFMWLGLFLPSPCWAVPFFATPWPPRLRERRFLHGNFCEDEGVVQRVSGRIMQQSYSSEWCCC
ncbi:hypothetical protein GH714_029897 [Hevea brasiliensis]|uniref:Uncharacterized protein n=1 Tax=Hevea brasiliensis TaxID=3981 RepID=A0A6A6KXR5_HEVBR|nr:hypothetical protein GH714_029897 [Hevea brasiliensis]